MKKPLKRFILELQIQILWNVCIFSKLATLIFEQLASVFNVLFFVAKMW